MTLEERLVDVVEAIGADIKGIRDDVSGIDDIAPVVMRVRRNSDVVLAAGNNGPLTFPTEDVDPDNLFTTTKFQPTKAGYYELRTVLFLTVGAGIQPNPYLVKNATSSDPASGTILANMALPVSGSAAAAHHSASALAYLNGTTDYVQVFVYAPNASITMYGSGAYRSTFEAFAVGVSGPRGAKGDEGDKGDTGDTGANAGSIIVNGAFAPVQEAVEFGTQVVLTTGVGVSNLTAGRRVLLTQQTDPKQNGIYITAGTGNPLVRATDADETADFFAGRTVADLKGGMWVYTGATLPTLGTDNLTWKYVGVAAGDIIAGYPYNVNTGPWPKSWDFYVPRTGTYMIDASFSAYATAVGLKRVHCRVDSSEFAQADFYINTINQYHAWPTAKGKASLTAGAHVFTLQPNLSTGPTSGAEATCFADYREIPG